MDDTTPSPEIPQPSPGTPTRRRRMLVGAGVAAGAVVAVVVAVVVASASSKDHNGTAAGDTRASVHIPAGSGPTGGGSTAAPGPGGSGSTAPGVSLAGGAGGTGPGGSSTSTSTSTGGASSGGTTVTTAPGGTRPHGSPGATTTTEVSTGVTDPDVSPAITNAYVAGYKNECNRLWSEAGPSGKLWDADDLDSPPHVIGECLAELDPTNAWFFFQDTPADAKEGGKEDADSTAESMTLGNRFQTSTGLVIYIP